MGAPFLGAPGPQLAGSSDRERPTPETLSVKYRRNVPAGEPSKLIMNVIEQHISVDGLLQFVACRDYSGDMTLGFAVACREGDNDITLNFYGHTHADILASLSGLPEAVAVRRYIDDTPSFRRASLPMRGADSRGKDPRSQQNSAPSAAA